MLLRFLLVLMAVLPGICFADISDNIPERRQSQFDDEPGYAVFPFPYSLPGIGSGLSLVGGASNMVNDYVDIYGLAFSGDVSGAAIGIRDIHLVPRRLILDLGGSAISNATITNYSQRGMDTDKDDFTLMELSNTGSYGTRLTATFFDRRVEIYGAYYRFWNKLERVLDNDGDLILEAEDKSTSSGDQVIVGTRFDLTDDYQDPRSGLRLDFSGWHNAREGIGPEYFLLDLNTTAYLPMGKRSTWVFNYFHSDAMLIHKGETDRAVVANDMGLDCTTITDPDNQQRCNDLIDTVVANNKYGTASSLGGFSRLRSYSQGRYSGAHSRFWGTEFRWNLTDEFTPFNLYFIRDVRTSIQVSFFYEIGTVAERASDLYDITRSSYGVGFRVITASGAVFRGDIAHGHEGFQPNIFIGYPWEF
ncbi:hypothetical protein [Kaarinaea lacus]